MGATTLLFLMSLITFLILCQASTTATTTSSSSFLSSASPTITTLPSRLLLYQSGCYFAKRDDFILDILDILDSHKHGDQNDAVLIPRNKQIAEITLLHLRGGGGGGRGRSRKGNEKERTPGSNSTSTIRGTEAAIATKRKTKRKKHRRKSEYDDLTFSSKHGARTGSILNTNKKINNLLNDRPQPLHTKSCNKYERSYDDKNETNNHSDNLPIIEAILLPRKISISYTVRLLSSILFTSSFIECILTSGIPFKNAVIHTLLSHNIKPQYHVDNTSPSSPSSSTKQVSSFDIYMARKIASSSSTTGNTISLPPPFLPTLIPFMGLLSSLFLYLGISILFPLWFVNVETWLNYKKVNVLHDYKVANDDINWIDMNDSNFRKRHNLIAEDIVRQIKSHLHYDIREKIVNKRINNQMTSTGLAVLVHLSKFDQEMGDENGKSHVIRMLHSEQSLDDENDDDDDDDDKHHSTKYYIELNQRRIYVDINIANVSYNNKNHPRDNEQCYMITTKCKDGSPTFYKRESIQQLHARLNNGIVHDSSSSCSSTTNKILTTDSLQRLHKYQQKYESYNKLSLPIPSIQKAFLSRITTPLAIMQFLGKLLSVVEDDSLAPSFFNIMSTLGRHYWSARKSIVSATELATEIQGNVNEGFGEQLYWTLRPKVVLKKRQKRKKRDRAMIKNQWELVPSSKILPGDVFCFPPDNWKELSSKKNHGTQTGIVMPVDALLLEGSCVALEAVITGESVPQAKVALDCGEPDSQLCLETKHRASVLFAGTNILQFLNEAAALAKSHNIVLKLPKEYVKSLMGLGQPVKCLALRTGSYSSKGEIVRALSKSKRHTGSITTPQSERDSIRLISVLTTFACFACASLFMPALQHHSCNERKVNAFRRVIQCTRIGVASIPSDLPLALSYVAQSCSTKLRKDFDVVCSEPGALLTASQIDMVVFDKTGTLTSDTQRLNRIIPPPSNSKIGKKYHPMTNAVLVGCNALVSINHNKAKTTLVGDPLDIASLDHSTWSFDGKTKSASSPVMEQNAVSEKLWQLKTFPFDSTRRRSSALLLVRRGDNYRLWIALKGSPDSVVSFLKFEDGTSFSKKSYMENVAELGSQGLRLITMAAKDISDDATLVRKLFPKGLPQMGSITDEEGFSKTISQARYAAKDCIGINDVEDTISGFDFVGFSCFDTVIRPSTKRVVKDLRSSGINVCMLTGDAPEAAFTVATKCGFYDKCSKTSVLLDTDDNNNNLRWTLNNRKGKDSGMHFNFTLQTVKMILQDAEMGRCSIVVTGKAFDKILDIAGLIFSDNHVACLHFLQNLNRISVISRSSPSTKQRVISAFKNYCGMNVMMCGKIEMYTTLQNHCVCMHITHV